MVDRPRPPDRPDDPDGPEGPGPPDQPGEPDRPDGREGPEGSQPPDRPDEPDGPDEGAESPASSGDALHRDSGPDDSLARDAHDDPQTRYQRALELTEPGDVKLDQAVSDLRAWHDRHAGPDGRLRVEDTSSAPDEPQQHPAEYDQPAETAEQDRPDGTRGYDLDQPLDDTTTPRDANRAFQPDRASLPDLTHEQAAAHIDSGKDTRPALAPAADRSPDVQRVIAAIDHGQGHALDRHEGGVTDEQAQRRVRFLEDPAQPDPDRRANADDAFKTNAQGEPKRHACGDDATRIHDPDAFATAFARVIENPEVRRALDSPFDPNKRPDAVSVPIDELLGKDGHQYCSGYTLLPIDDSMQTARDHRKAWADARRDDREPDVPEPRAEPIDTFRGWDLQIAFRPNSTKTGWEVVTMYPQRPTDYLRGT